MKEKDGGKAWRKGDGDRDEEGEKGRKTVGGSEKGRNGSRRHSRNYGLRLRLDTSLE